MQAVQSTRKHHHRRGQATNLNVSHGSHPGDLIHRPEVHVDALRAETQGAVHRQAVHAHEAALVHAGPDVTVVRQLRVAVRTSGRDTR